MERRTIFENNIWIDQITNLNYKELSDECYRIRNNDFRFNEKNLAIAKIFNSNYHSDNILDNFIFKKCFDEIQNRINLIIPEFGFKKNLTAKIAYGWFNIIGNNDNLYSHTHVGSIISGVLYVNALSNNQGFTVFENESSVDIREYYFSAKQVDVWNPLNSSKYFIEPRTGNLALFPGWQKHSVIVNKTDIDRISISFNSFLFDENNKRITTLELFS